MASILSSLRSVVSSTASVVDNGANTLTGTFALMSEEVDNFRNERTKNRLVASQVNDAENDKVLRELIVADEIHAIKCAEELAKVEATKTDEVRSKLDALASVMANKYNR